MWRSCQSSLQIKLMCDSSCCFDKSNNIPFYCFVPHLLIFFLPTCTFTTPLPILSRRTVFFNFTIRKSQDHPHVKATRSTILSAVFGTLKDDVIFARTQKYNIVQNFQFTITNMERFYE